MLQIRRRGDLGEEPLRADHGGQLRFEHLERDLAPVLQVLGEIDRRHATRAELSLDAVAVGECAGEARSGVAHGAAGPRSENTTTVGDPPRPKVIEPPPVVVARYCVPPTAYVTIPPKIPAPVYMR
jgi:hypothetical protein